MARLFIAALLVLFLPELEAEAAPDIHANGGAWSSGYAAPQRVQGRRSAVRHAPRTKMARHSIKRTRTHLARSAGVQIVVAHPPGCPRRAFCGCGTALFVFGHHVRELWLASNWLRFPRAAPAPGMVAARPGHVMAIMQAHGDGTATVYDPNSGRHLTRIHRRSLAGFRVVNPRVRTAGAG